MEYFTKTISIVGKQSREIESEPNNKLPTSDMQSVFHILNKSGPIPNGILMKSFPTQDAGGAYSL